MRTTQMHLARTTLGIFLAYASFGWRKSARLSTRWTIVPGLLLSINLVIQTLLHILNGQILFRHIWTIISIVILYSLFGQWKSVVSSNIFGWVDKCFGHININYHTMIIMTLLKSHSFLQLIKISIEVITWKVFANLF